MNYKLHKQYRLPEYDYGSEGSYFVTICTKEHKCYLGQVVSQTMELSQIGEIVRKIWVEIPMYFNNVELDKWIIMPNHIHGIIIMKNNEEKNLTDSSNLINQKNLINQIPTGEFKSGIRNNPMELRETTLGRIIRWFMGRVKFDTNKNGFQHFVWQSRFYDHVIRDEKSLNSIRQYIVDNPVKWEIEKNNTENFHI